MGIANLNAPTGTAFPTLWERITQIDLDLPESMGTVRSATTACFYPQLRISILVLVPPCIHVYVLTSQSRIKVGEYVWTALQLD